MERLIICAILFQYISVLVKVVEKEGRQSCHNVILVLKHLEEIDELFCMRPEIVNILVNAFCVAHICREDQRYFLLKNQKSIYYCIIIVSYIYVSTVCNPVIKNMRIYDPGMWHKSSSGNTCYFQLVI